MHVRLFVEQLHSPSHVLVRICSAVFNYPKAHVLFHV